MQAARAMAGAYNVVYATRRFDLSAADHLRDLNLAPELIAWVEQHYGMRKLRSDYPHWTDAAAGR